jgi:hypothetical protein
LDLGGGQGVSGGGAPFYRDPSISHLSNFVHIILLGTDGSLFLPIDSILTDILQIPSLELPTLLRRLHTHSISYTQAIIRRRRALDFDPLSVALPHHSHNPP